MYIIYYKMKNYEIIQKSLKFNNYKPIILLDEFKKLIQIINKKFKIIEMIEINSDNKINNFNNNKIKLIIVELNNVESNNKFNENNYIEIIENELNLLDKTNNLNIFDKYKYAPIQMYNVNYTYSDGCWKGKKILTNNYLIEYELLKFKNNFKNNIHVPIFPNDSQDIFKLFNIKKYISNTKFININNLRAKIWLNKIGHKKKLVKISETPHYLYLNNQKIHYEKYIKIDHLHSLEKYNELINTLNKDYIFNNINYITIEVISKNDIYIITGGIHRASIYLKNNIQYIRCVIF